MKDKERIINRIIREQDLVALYACNPYNKSLGFMTEYDDGIYYSSLSNFIIENPKIMDSFSVKNLYLVLASANKEDDIKKINEILGKKFEHEEFFCEDIDRALFMIIAHTNNNYSKIDEDIRQKIRN